MPFNVFYAFSNAFSMFFNSFQCVPLLFNASSMLFQCVSMLFNAFQCFAMLFQCFSMLVNAFSMLFDAFSMLFVAFCDFSYVFPIFVGVVCKISLGFLRFCCGKVNKNTKNEFLGAGCPSGWSGQTPPRYPPPFSDRGQAIK